MHPAGYPCVDATSGAHHPRSTGILPVAPSSSLPIKNQQPSIINRQSISSLRHPLRPLRLCGKPLTSSLRHPLRPQRLRVSIPLPPKKNLFRVPLRPLRLCGKPLPTMSTPIQSTVENLRLALKKQRAINKWLIRRLHAEQCITLTFSKLVWHPPRTTLPIPPPQAKPHPRSQDKTPHHQIP